MARSRLIGLQGELQERIMRALWHLGQGSVDDVRSALSPRYQGAYTTVQTVLNRLAERRLVSRRRTGNLITYRPRLTEAEFVSRSLSQTLAGASKAARQAALAHLVDEMDDRELGAIRERAREIDRRGTGA